MADDQYTEGNETDESEGTCDFTFAVKANRAGKRYLLVIESRPNSTEERRCLIVFAEQMPAFHSAYVRAAKRLKPNLKAYDLASIRKSFPRAYEPWTPEEDEELAEQYGARVALPELARRFQRQLGAISSRVRHLGLTLVQSSAATRSAVGGISSKKMKR